MDAEHWATQTEHHLPAVEAGTEAVDFGAKWWHKFPEAEGGQGPHGQVSVRHELEAYRH